MRKKLASLAAIFSTAMAVNYVNAATVPYAIDFEGAVGSEWSNSTVDQTHPTPFTRFSGRFGNATQTLSLSDLTAGTSYTIGFDLYILDTWDGNANNDTFAVEVNGEQRFAYTFSNYNGNPPSSPQSYPNDPDEGRADFGFFGGYVDAIYRNVEVSFTPTGTTAEISFKGINLQDISDESWGVDNVSVKRTVDLGQTAVRSTTLPAEGSSIGQAAEGFSLVYSRMLNATAAEAVKYSLREAGANTVLGDADDNVIALTPTVSGKTVTLQAGIFPLQPGKYQFKASGLTDLNGSAVVNFTRNFNVAHPVLGRIENLDNNTLELASPLPLTESPAGSTFFTSFGSGYINTVGDVDYWRFDAEAGDVMTMRFELAAVNSYPQVYLQNSSGGNVYPSGGGWDGLNGWQRVVIPAPGTYYLRVWSDYARGPYQLRVDLSRGVQLELEENDSFAQANLFNLATVSSTYQGKIEGTLETGDPNGDHSRLGTLNVGNALNLSLTFPAGSSLSANTTKIDLFKEGVAEPVASNESGNLNFTALEDGTYFVRLAAATPHIRAQYVLSATITDGVKPLIVGLNLPGEGSESQMVIDRFKIDFSEELLPTTVTNSASYDLRAAGADNNFGTADDILYVVENQTYATGLSVLYLVKDGPLQPGSYQFTAKTSITDRAGNTLPVAVTRKFTVAGVTPFVLEARLNNSMETATALALVENPAASGVKTAYGRGNVSGAEDMDYWSFQGTAGQLVSVASENLGNSPATGLVYYLVNSANGVIHHFYTSYYGRGQFNPYVLPADGVYYVRVQRQYDYVGEYRFRVTTYPSTYNGEYEDNNSVGQAQSNIFQAEGNSLTSKTVAYANAEDGSGDYYRLGNFAPGTVATLSLTQPSDSPFSGVMQILLQDGTTLTNTEAGASALRFPVGPTGNYFVRVTDAAGGGLSHQYLLQVTIVDGASPTITGLNLPAENSSNDFVHPNFDINFSEDMLPETVTNLESYELRSAGIDGIFNNSDDLLYAITPANYVNGLSARYTIVDGPLQPGSYRFTIKTAVKDRNGNSLAAPYLRHFKVSAVAGYVLESRNNDTSSTATSLSPAVQNQPDGSFAIGELLSIPGSNPFALIALHLNGDNRLDLVTANFHSADISIFMAQAGGGFAHKTNYPTASGAINVAGGDLNGDGKLDLVVANFNASSISVLIGIGEGEFAPAVNYSAGNAPRAIALADFNGDNRLDVAVPHYNATTTGIFLGKGDGTLNERADVTVGNNPHGIAAADMNSDGMIDLLVPNYSSASVSLLMGNGNGTFAPAKNLGSGPYPRSVTVGDFNADGELDFATINNGNGTVSVFLGKPDGSFQDHVEYPAGSADPYHIIGSDVNKDGVQDLLVASYGNSEVKILFGKANGAFQTPAKYRLSGNPIWLAPADFNNDGNLEIATANHGNSSIGFLYPNPTQNLAEDPTGSSIRTAFARGNLTDANDLDYYSFSGLEGDRVILATETPGHLRSSGLLFEIFSSDGAQLTYVYPDASGWGQTPPVTLPFDGTYTVRVRQWHAYYGEYRFRLTLARPPVQLEREGNNNFNEPTAVELSLGSGGQSSTLLGYISAGDQDAGDYFSLGNLSGGTSIRLGLNKPISSAVAIKMTIFNTQRAAVAESAPGSALLEYIIPDGADGAYYVHISSTGPSREGDAGPFMSFNGGNQYVNTGNWAPGTKWTTEAWVRPSVVANGRRNIAGGYGECRDWGITMENGQFGVVIRQPGGCSLTIGSGVYVEVDKWFHVVGSSDGQNAYIYINGELKATAPVDPDYSGTAAGTWIGGESCCGNYFPGLIDEVRIWNRAITVDEIRSNMTRELAGNESGLVGYWRFDEGNGTTISDRSSSAHHGTVANNAPWISVGSATASGAGLASQYIVSLSLGDTAPPTITSVSLPTEGAVVSFVEPNFTVGFSEDMTSATVTSEANYELRSAGRDNVFDNADDELYALEISPYSSGLTGSIRIVDGPVQPGNYRFTIKTGIEDRSGSPLQANYVRTFKVEGVAGFVLESRNNDSFATATSLAAIFNNNPDGSFVAGIESQFGGNTPWSIVSGHFNGDAHLDVVIANNGSASVSFFAGNGDGTLKAPQNFSVGNNPRRLAAGDLNGDGKLDLAVANRGSANVSILLGDGNGSFQTAVNYPANNGPYGVTIGDFNKDNRLDLAVANELNDSISVLLNAGNGVYGTAVHYAVGDAPYEIITVDLNGDAVADLVTANAGSGNASILFGKADGTFNPASNKAVGRTPRSVTAGDLNGDGKADLAVLNASDNTVSILIGNGDGTHREQIVFPAATSDPYQIVSSDMNGDSKLDLVLASYGNREVVVLQGLGDGTFYSPARISAPSNPISVVAADFNGDGRLDIATADHSVGAVDILASRGTELLTENPAGSAIRTGTGRGHLSHNQDIDVWSFSGQAGDRFELAVESLDDPGSSGLFYELNGSSGERIAYLYPDSRGFGQTPYSNEPMVILPYSGRFYIQVKHWHSYYKEYRFRVTLARPPVHFERESNATLAEATSVHFEKSGNKQIGKTVGYLHRTDAVDTYALGHLASGTVIRASWVKPIGSSANVTLEIVTAGGESLGASSAVVPELNVTLPANASGLIYLLVKPNAETHGLLSQYVLTTELSDGSAPAILGETLPLGDSPQLMVIDRFSVNYSKDMLPESINNAANFTLASAGGDGNFGTSDDVVYNVRPFTPYRNGLSSLFQIIDGPLQAGTYLFRVNSNVQDRFGNSLPAVYERQFTLSAPPGTVIESRENESMATATALSMIQDPQGFFSGLGVGNLTSTEDHDYWSFDAVAGQKLVVAVQTKGSPNNSSRYVRINNPDGSRIVDFNSDGLGYGDSGGITIPANGK
ncbi:MAG: FG-GAP-like repeat-containing protein, partial [Verrucomicrobiales bacterium]